MSSFEELLQEALSVQVPKTVFGIKPVSQDLIAHGAGINVDLSNHGYLIRATGLRHAMNRHGNYANEAVSGQIALTTWHLRQIPQILSSPHQIENAPGLCAFKLKKDFYEQGNATLILEGSTFTSKSKTYHDLVFKTLYWHRPR